MHGISFLSRFLSEMTVSLATVLRKYLDERSVSIYRLSNASGVDPAYIGRVLNGARQNVSRQLLIRLSLSLALELGQLSVSS